MAPGVFLPTTSPLTWHSSSNSSKSTLPFPSKSTWSARQLGVEFCRHFVSQIALRTEKRHLIRYGSCNHIHTYWLTNQPSCNNIYPGACSFYTTHNFLHLLEHPLQQLLLMEEIGLTNSYPIRYMYGTLTTFGWSLCLSVGKYTKHGSSGYRI